MTVLAYPPQRKEKIFGEGYGKGSGYGLFLIRKICEVYGWFIREKGAQDKGAKFGMTIPKMNMSGKANYLTGKNAAGNP